jgi:hypothetical protein
MSGEEYCREVEAYLCRKNDGHLIRIVGPSFERVLGWASEGIPFKIACQGIDRTFTRYYAKGPRRRPVLIDFCDVDVRDAFDEWRRAVGVRLPGVAIGEQEAVQRRRHGLVEHLNRVLERITGILTARVPPSADFKAVLERIATDVSSLSDLPSPMRGKTRSMVTDRLAELDRSLLDAAREEAEPELLDALRRDAEDQLSVFRDRLPVEEYGRALNAAIDRLLRDRRALPTVAFD